MAMRIRKVTCGYKSGKKREREGEREEEERERRGGEREKERERLMERGSKKWLQCELGR